MGVVNVTPDSFYDGGRHGAPAAAIDHAWRLVEEGADIIDVGGESTRPGAAPVSEEQELDRVMPVIEALRGVAQTAVSVDSGRPGVMRAAAAAGAALINDVRALQGHAQAFATARELGLPVCLMHMLGEPRSMQLDPSYTDVVSEVHGFLLERARACVAAGWQPATVLLDPGIGFGKRLAHNLALLRALSTLVASGYPVLLGVSRKSMLGELTGQPADARLPGSLAAALHGARCGVRVLRVHDVAATVQALQVWHALQD